MIVTLDEAKALAIITDSTQDELIQRLLPIIESDIREYCNNGFFNRNVYLMSSAISFTHNSTSADTINLDIGANEDGFAEAQFKDGNTVQVIGSFNNNNVFEIESVSSTALTLYTEADRPYAEQLVTEDENALVRIDQIKYPPALKSIVGEMLRYKLSTHDHSIKSEMVARYSVTFNQDLSGGYPSSIMTGLNRWRNPVLV